MVPWTAPPPSDAQVWELLYFISYNHSMSSKTVSYTLITSLYSFRLHHPLCMHLAMRRVDHSTRLSRGYWTSLRTQVTRTVVDRTRTIRMCKCLYDDNVCVGTMTNISSWWLCWTLFVWPCDDVGWELYLWLDVWYLCQRQCGWLYMVDGNVYDLWYFNVVIYGCLASWKYVCFFVLHVRGGSQNRVHISVHAA